MGKSEQLVCIMVQDALKIASKFCWRTTLAEGLHGCALASFVLKVLVGKHAIKRD
jgi:hypothetical protein